MFSKKLYLSLELIVLFFLLPVLYLFSPIKIHILLILSAITVLCLIIHYFSGNELSFKVLPIPSNLIEMFLTFFIISILLGIFVYIYFPENFFSFPLKNTKIWILVMFFYPILSVLPQEFIYRVFFISRYREILGGERSMNLVNALAFAFLHIVFKNSLAVILTFIASFIFYRNYQRNHSLFWVSFEHYLYGAMIFSIGLGRFFYNGVH